MREPERIASQRRALGERLAAFREAAELTQGDLARRVFCHRTTVVHVEKGRRAADEQFWNSVDAAVNAGGVLLAAFHKIEANKQAEEYRVRAAKLADAYRRAHTWPDQVSNSLVQFDLLDNGHPVAQDENTFEGTGEPAQRMALIAELSASTDGLHRPEFTHVGARYPGDLRGAADTDYVIALREATQQLVHLEGQYGGDDVLRLAVRAFRTSYKRLALGTCLPHIERDLQSAVGELGEVAAWIAYDANQQTLSRDLNHEALLISRLAGDRDMELFELSNLAMQANHLHRPAEAMRIAEYALADDILSPRTAALFHARKARALAQTGERHRSFDALDRAMTLLAEGVSTQDPPWTWWLDDSELAWHRAMCLADLDEWRPAVDLFRQAYELRAAQGSDSIRRRVHYNDLAHLLEALVTVQAWRDVDDTLADIMPYVGEVSSARTAVLLRRTIRRIEESRTSATSTVVARAAALQQLLR